MSSEADQFTWDSALSEQESKNRIHRVRRSMKKRSLDALIIYTSPQEFPRTTGYVRYVSNWSGDRDRYSSLVILPANEHPELIINGENFMPMAEEASWIKEVRVMKKNLGTEIKNSLSGLGIESGILGLVGYDEMTVDEYHEVEKALAKYELRRSESALDELRLIKSSEEIELHQKAASICDEALERFKEIAKPGVKEHEAYVEMEYCAAHQGAEKSGCTITSGPYAGLQPTTPRTRKFAKNDIVIVSSVFRFKGYWAQVIRTGSIGGSSDHQQRIFSMVSEAHKLGIKAVKPGDTLMKVYEAITGVTDTSEHEKQNHIHFRLAHGMGLSYAEKPALAFHTTPLDNSMTLEPGMMIELHPNILLSHQKMGAALGDLFVVTESGADLLTKSDSAFFTT